MSSEAPKSIPWADRGGKKTVVQPRSARDVEILRSLARRINPHDAGAHNNLGVVYYNKGLYPEAITHFEKALELDPRMHVAERNLQIAYFHTGYFETMVTELRQRLEKSPGDADAHDRLARAYFYGGDVQSAIGEWRKAVQFRPDRFDLHLKLARAEQQRGSLDAALVLLQAALVLEPNSPHAHLLHGELLYQTNKPPEARTALETALKFDSRLAEAHHLLAFVYGEMGDYHKAELAAARAAELNPTYKNAHANLSLDSYNAARYEELVGERSKPDVAESGTLAHYNLGLAFRQKALYDEALREFRLATERGEDKLLVQQAEAEMLLLRGDTQTATTLYEDLVKEEPTSPKLWNELGVARHQAGRLDDAERAYRHSLDNDPDYALAWNNLAVVRHHKGDAHESESAFRAALAHGRAIADVWRNMGLMLARTGRTEHALDAYKRALEADPESPVAYAGLGITLMDSGRPAEAKAALVRAVELDPTLPEARYHLAFALSALGDYQGALRETKHALDLNPYIPQPRYKLLIDLQFEEASVLAPELDSAQRVMAPVGESIPQFEFNAESLEAAFTAALPESDQTVQPAVPAATEATADGNAMLETARAALAQGKLDDAIEHAQRALRAGADRREFLLLQGDIYVRRDFPGEAVERYVAVLGEVSAHGDPSSDVTHDILRRALAGAASCFIELGRMAEAVEAAERLCGMAPNDGGALRLLGRALARVSDHQRAIIVLEQALATEGESASLLTELGAAYQAGGKLQAAEESLRRAAELDDFAIGARVLLGRLLIATGRIDDAAVELRSALDFIPSHGDAAFALADLERSRGRTREAVNVLIDLLSVDPYHLDALVKLGALLAESGRIADARMALQRVLRFDPGHAAAQRLLHALTAQPAMQAS